VRVQTALVDPATYVKLTGVGDRVLDVPVDDGTGGAALVGPAGGPGFPDAPQAATPMAKRPTTALASFLVWATGR
jgi:hypothetical protein